ncbi:MAG TPA: hypothetical protein VFZ21_23815, partial [Gemmatimonadaceae bacterium]|nr:hypothetical protein [Gemmatimonadaceae bacterium]
MRSRRYLPAVLILAAIAAAPAPASAQIGGALRKRAEEAKRKAEEAAAKKIAGDTAKPAPAGDAARPAAASSPAAAAPATAQASGAAPAGKADPKVWENYDFVPGNKILFFTDFSEDKVGNFARGLKYVTGPIEVVERDGEKMLRSTARSTILIPVGRV